MHINRNIKIKFSVVSLIILFGLFGSRLAFAQENTPTIYWQSYDLEVKRKIQSAIDVLKKLPEDQKQTYFFHVRHGWLLYLLGDFSRSVMAYQKGAKLEPGSEEPLLGMLLPMIASKRWKDADAAAKKALQLVPKDIAVLTKHAWILYNMGRYSEAEKGYRIIIKRYPANLEMQAGLGWALLKQGKKGEAANLFKNILRYSPKYQTALEGLAAANS